MGYTAHELARISAVSVRTLHYYEEQGLLHPARRDNGYRDYGEKDVRRLQQILLFRQADMPLAEIRRILHEPADVQTAALRTQLEQLRSQRTQLDGLIATVEGMIAESDTPSADAAPTASAEPQQADESREDTPMTSTSAQHAARFEALKQQALAENERNYGSETRQRYGNKAVDAANKQVEGMTEHEWNEAEAQRQRIGDLLASIAASSDPTEQILGEAGKELCELHRAWLMHYWTPAMYSPDAHRGLGQMYVADERFAATYEALAPGGAQIMCDAIDAWAGR